MPKNLSRFTRLARIALVLTSLAVAFSAVAGTGIASAKSTPHVKQAATAKRAHTTTSLPAQGIFGSCDLDTELATCEQDLEAMHQAGLQVVVQTATYTLADMSAFAQYAQSIGMSVMWEIDDAGFWGGIWNGSSAAADYSAFSTACGCSDTSQVLDYMIHWLAALPATYGYYAADADDESIDTGQLAPVTQYIDEIKADDPNHMVMMGTRQSQGTSLYSSGATMGNEIYPETTSNPMPYGRNLATWDTVQQSVTQDSRGAQEDGEQSAFILQSFTFGDNLWDGEAVGVCTASMTQSQCASKLAFPSASVQIELRNEVLEHSHPKLILWFNFAETYGQGDRWASDRWASLTRAINAPYPVSATAARAKAKRAKAKRSEDRKKAAKRAAKRAAERKVEA